MLQVVIKSLVIFSLNMNNSDDQLSDKTKIEFRILLCDLMPQNQFISSKLTKLLYNKSCATCSTVNKSNFLNCIKSKHVLHITLVSTHISKSSLLQVMNKLTMSTVLLTVAIVFDHLLALLSATLMYVLIF